MLFRPGDHVFVDESKAHGYHLAAVGVAPGDIPAIEKALKTLRTGGRSTIHFKREGNRRDSILRAINDMPMRVSIFTMRHASDRVARPLLIEELIQNAVHAGVAMIVVERDESIELIDRQVMHAELIKVAAANRPTYGHARAVDRPILWVADAVAWCYQKGEAWPKKVDHIVEAHIELDLP